MKQHFLYGAWNSTFISTSRPDSNQLEMKSMDAFAPPLPPREPIHSPAPSICDIGQDWARSRDSARRKALGQTAPLSQHSRRPPGSTALWLLRDNSSGDSVTSYLLSPQNEELSFLIPREFPSSILECAEFLVITLKFRPQASGCNKCCDTFSCLGVISNYRAKSKRLKSAYTFTRVFINAVSPISCWIKEQTLAFRSLILLNLLGNPRAP